MSPMQSNGNRTGESPPALFGSRASPTSPEHVRHASQRGMLVCVNDISLSADVVTHALAVARALDLPVTVARVLEAPKHLDSPADPLEWQLRRSECRRTLDQIVSTADQGAPQLDSVLLAGPPADELTDWARNNDVTLMAMATHEHGKPQRTGLGSTVQGVLNRSAASLLLVPPGTGDESSPTYRRLLVPLDGSPRAESVLPVAIRIARANGAELILAHAVPRVEIAEDSLGEEHARDLCARVEEHNERHARAYLEELRARLWNDGLSVRSIVVTHGDPRAMLRRLALDHRVDLIVLSSHGRSGLDDVPCGSVTDYLAGHAPAPLLIVRPNIAHVFGKPDGPDNGIVATPIAAAAG